MSIKIKNCQNMSKYCYKMSENKNICYFFYYILGDVKMLLEMF